MAPPAPAAPNTRARLLDAAARQMAEVGYPGASVRAIAAEAGVTTGALYASFPGGKVALFEAILDELTAEVRRVVAAALADATDPVDALVRQARAMWDFFEARPSFAALVVRENIRGALGDPSRMAVQTAGEISQLRELIQAAAAEGVMAPVNPSAVMFWVTTTTTTFHGCRPLREAVWTADDAATARDEFLTQLRRLLTPLETP